MLTLCAENVNPALTSSLHTGMGRSKHSRALVAAAPLAVLLTLLVLLDCCTAFIKVDTSSQQLVDNYGRKRLFHGVNAVYKIFPWHPILDHFDPQLSLADQDIANLRKWGFNSVRLGVMWPGVEPTQGNYNETYLKVMQGLVEKLGQNGIYTIIDFHQDLYNRQFCGEGAPDWATKLPAFALPFPVPALGLEQFPLDSHGYPPLDKCLNHSFAMYYLAHRTGAAFQSLYDNVDGIQDSFVNFWNKVSTVFNTSEYVLGYEIINEPFPGDVYMNPTLVWPGKADRVNLAPMYKRVHDAIRANGDDHMIFFEKSLVSIGEAGFDSGPGGPAYNDRQVFSYHIYCQPTDEEGSPSNILICDFEDAILDAIAIADVKRLGCGGFLTEFGAMNEEVNSLKSIKFLADFADNNLQSWTYWQFKLFEDITTAGPGESFYDANGVLESKKVRALSRSYAQAVAGTPTYHFFNSATANFTLVYNIDVNIAQPTELYLNEQFYYPNGFQVLLSPATAAKWTQPAVNQIFVYSSATTKQGTPLTVTVLPKVG